MPRADGSLTLDELLALKAKGQTSVIVGGTPDDPNSAGAPGARAVTPRKIVDMQTEGLLKAARESSRLAKVESNRSSTLKRYRTRQLALAGRGTGSTILTGALGLSGASGGQGAYKTLLGA